MNIFMQPLAELSEYEEIMKDMKKNTYPIQVTGCVDGQKSQFISCIGQDFKYKVIVAPDEIKAKEMYEEYRLFDREAMLYPAKDIIFYTADVHGSAILHDRLQVIKRIVEGIPTTIITTIDAGMDSLLPLEYIKSNIIDIKVEGIIDIEQFKLDMVKLGYERVTQVENPGEYTIRGGIIDVYPLTEETPYRIELWDDEIDTIRTFDVESQRSIENITSMQIYPACEIVLDGTIMQKGIKKIDKELESYVNALRGEMKNEEASRITEIVNEFKEQLDLFNGSMAIDSYIKYFYDNTVSFFDYFNNDDSLIILDEVARIEERGKAIELEFSESMIGRLEKGYILPSQVDVISSYKNVIAKLNLLKVITLSIMDYKIESFKVKNKYDLVTKSISSYNNNFELLVEDLLRWKKVGYRVVLITNSLTRAKRMASDLLDRGLNAFYSDDLERIVQSREIMIVYGNFNKGFEYPLVKFAYITDSDIFGKNVKKKKKKKTYSGKKIQSFTDLNVGDYVVHENHGIGVYKGIEKIEVDNIVKDYVRIEYANDGVLFVLATGLDSLQKFAGSDAKKPKINKLNSVEWKNTKARVKGAVKDIAKELVELYAIRQSKEGHQFSKDSVWQREFEETFMYEETKDQLEAIEATKKDMESSKIMDRLICGDVGYGKTEIAIRAAFKAVGDSKQVVFLVPTTILAQQHYNTFKQRMKDFPVNIEMLSRFRTPKEQKKTIERLKSGACDIVIGTHRVLSKDITFKNLGLLIVDEEQRFGVTHKERIKQMKSDVDVLTLSATPIPRTLHMSLVGIRDMSVLEEPPVDRLPIQTYVLEHNEEIIREAINRELARGGQVYYVYNRVNTIVEMTNIVARLVPDANVAFAHGQMSERELENIMYDFINGEIDVLVSTTIVETGLDISNVNTIIIDEADRFGLSQLYQLRGRVGRGNRTAYAFLMYKRNKVLKEVAEKRLKAIREFTELGSGFRIAMKDLEIRGAGNLLGAKQHGHMEAVGYDLYCKMLNEAVMELKGEITEDEEFETTIDINIDAYIPATYVKSEYQKLDLYKRIAEIANDDDYMEIQDELIDRFGDIPKAVSNLLDIAMIKVKAHKCYIEEVINKGNKVKFAMNKKAKVDVSAIPKLIEACNNKIRFVPDKNPYFEYTIDVKKTGKLIQKQNNLCKEINEVLNNIDEFIIMD